MQGAVELQCDPVKKSQLPPHRELWNLGVLKLSVCISGGAGLYGLF